jgi:hypothetical protein
VSGVGAGVAGAGVPAGGRALAGPDSSDDGFGDTGGQTERTEATTRDDLPGPRP